MAINPDSRRILKLKIILAVSTGVFLTELAIGYLTHSLALIADAFHYLNDLISYVIILAAFYKENGPKPPEKTMPYGWIRVKILGAFMNGAFTAALGLSIFLQAIERFCLPERVENPKWVLIAGAVGLGSNLLSFAIGVEHHGHSHSHPDSRLGNDRDSEASNAPLTAFTDVNIPLAPTPKPSHDHAMRSVIFHIMGDAFSNFCVMASALIMWFWKDPRAVYADPTTGVIVSLVIFALSWPMIKENGIILLESAPNDTISDQILDKLRGIPGVNAEATHDLHVWSLNQFKHAATLHVVVEEESMRDTVAIMKQVGKLLQELDIHQYCIQPEVFASHQNVVLTNGVIDDKSIDSLLVQRHRCVLQDE